MIIYNFSGVLWKRFVLNPFILIPVLKQNTLSIYFTSSTICYELHKIVIVYHFKKIATKFNTQLFLPSQHDTSNQPFQLQANAFTKERKKNRPKHILAVPQVKSEME